MILIMFKRYLIIIVTCLSVSGCSYFSDAYLVCEGEEEIREGIVSKEKFVRGVTATLKKDLLGRPESLTVESKSWASYDGKYLYTSQPGYYVFRDGDANSEQIEILLKPENGKTLLLRKQAGNLVFSAGYICRRVVGIK
jgi:hypothetical protein